MPYINERIGQDVGDCAEEDSFVILGSTPTPSMDLYMGSNNFASTGSATPINSQQSNGGDLTSIAGRSMMSAKTPSLEVEQAFSMLSTSGSGAVEVNPVVPPVGSFLLGESSGYAMNASINPFVMRNSVLDPSRSSPGVSQQVLEDGGVTPNSQNISQPIEVDGHGSTNGGHKNESVRSIPALRSANCTSLAANEGSDNVSSVSCVHQKLMENLEKTNIAMSQHFEMVANFNRLVTSYKKEHQDKVNQLESESMQLKMNITQLEKELNEQRLVFTMRENMAQNENQDLIKELSNSRSIIMNMSETIKKLECNMHSFEMVSHTSKELDLKSSYLTPLQRSNSETSRMTAQYEAQIKDLNAVIESKAALIGELEHKVALGFGDRDMIAQLRDIVQKHISNGAELKLNYDKLQEKLAKTVAESERLQAQVVQQNKSLQESIKENYTSFQAGYAEMQQFSDQTINRLQTELRAKDEKINLLENEKSHIVVMLEAESRNLSKCEKARKELEVEVTLLNEQLVVYKTDFDIERTSRQDLASEREELLSDLKLLQRRNEELMKKSQDSSSRSSPSSSTAASAMDTTTSSAATHKFICPICSRQYKDYNSLSSHVNDCLI